MLLIIILNVPYNKVLASSYTQLVVNTSKKSRLPAVAPILRQ